MADLRAEAMELLSKIPEENMPQVLSQIATMYEEHRPRTASEKAEDARRAMDALDRIVERARKNRDKIPADFDYKKELEEVREERYKKYV